MPAFSASTRAALEDSAAASSASDTQSTSRGMG
jgi:hypothetical protein